MVWPKELRPKEYNMEWEVCAHRNICVLLYCAIYRLALATLLKTPMRSSCISALRTVLDIVHPDPHVSSAP
jgi:hypothetical protein